jgi:hypothetical protein
MSSLRIRPRFAHTVGFSPDETRARVLQALARHAPALEVRPFPGYVGLHFPERARRLWTPRLALHFQATPEGATRIEGLYGPDADLWSLFLYGYLLLGTLGIFAGILGGAQLAIHAPPWGLWALGAAALLALLLHLGAHLGRRLGAAQMRELHRAYETAIGRPAGIT